METRPSQRITTQNKVSARFLTFEARKGTKKRSRVSIYYKMDSDGALQLSNSSYLENQKRFYNELLESQEMSDVTLACDCDGYEIGAHKTIISASSLFFREVIRKSKHPNPYIYLKGVSKEVLEALLKFIYKGEVTVRSAILQNLVDVGSELQIEGLMEEKLKTNEKTRKKEEDVIESQLKEIDNSDFNIADFVKIEPYDILEHEQENCDKHGVVDADNDSVGRSDNKEELAGEIAKRMVEIFDEQGVKQYECIVCHKKQSHKIKMKMHVETHLEGFSHTCKFFGLVKKTTSALQLHVYNQHSRSKSGKAAADVNKT